MRPMDIYALPASETEPWYDAYGPIGHLFGDDMLESELDRERAREARAGALAFETKLRHNGDGSRSATFLAATYEGRPFALLVLSGRGGDERTTRVVTDPGAFLAARAFIDTQRGPEEGLERDTADPSADIAALSGPAGYRVATAPDGTVRLVPEFHLSADGAMVLDEVAFRAHANRAWRAASARGAPMPPLNGSILRNRERLASVVPSIEAAIPEGLRRATAFSIPGPAGLRGWVGAIGPLELKCRRLGGPELFDAFAEDAHAAAPAP
jgi:hypothetical protein